MERATMPDRVDTKPRLSPSTNPAGRLAGRASAIAWAVARAEDPRTVYLDTETTGLGADAEVIDVAVVGWDGSLLFGTLIRPIKPVPASAHGIHGISNDHLARSPSWPSIYEALASVLAGRNVIVYNASFDRRMVAQSCQLHRLTMPDLTWECAMRAYAQFHAATDPARGIRMHKLSTAAAAFGASPGTHRAASDARACRSVVLGLASSAEG
jgi:DNA polymerase-3 subunit epsilon